MYTNIMTYEYFLVYYYCYQFHSDYPMECACGRRNSCHVTSRGVRTRKSKKEPVVETEQVHVPTDTPTPPIR